MLYTKNNWDSYFNIRIENPLKTWWKARKYFKFPKIKFKFYLVHKYGPYPYATYHWIGKILDISIIDVSWKDKYNSPRHEESPNIFICLFRKFALSIFLYNTYYNEFNEKVNGDLYYWEYLLSWLYYTKDRSLKCYSTWITDSKIYKEIIYGNEEDGSEDVTKPRIYTIPVVAMSLNKRGMNKLKGELNNENNK